MSKAWEQSWVEREMQRRSARNADFARDVARFKQQERRPEVPVFSECVIGYRQWRCDPLDQLWPMTRGDTPWVPGVNTASCVGDDWYFITPFSSPNLSRKHRAPHRDCECGLYAWRGVEQVWGEVHEDENELHMPLVCGATAFWGDVQVHREGFRAEHACIVALSYRDLERPEVRVVLHRLAARYRVPLVRFDDLETEALMSGAPLPESLRPPPPAHPAYTAIFSTPFSIIATGGSAKP